MAELILGVSGARGIVGETLDERIAVRLALAFASGLGPGPVVIGRDSRPSGRPLAGAAIAALASEGRAVLDLGLAPTPTVQVAVEAEGAAGGVVITASHNPPAWNGLKFISPAGTFLDAPAMKDLIARFEAAGGCGRGGSAERPAASLPASAAAAGERAVRVHLERILRASDRERIRAAALRVVVDAVHGAAPVLIGPLLAALGVEVRWIDGEPDGRLPARPEPRAERLEPLARVTEEARAQVGFALDPDGDRCALVLPGEVLGEEWALPLCAYHLLAQGARGPLVANLSTSARLDWVAARYGVPVERTPVGEAHVVSRMKSRAAMLGGEGNGGVIDPRVHYGRDAGVAISHLLGLEATGPGGRGGIARAVALFPPMVLIKRELAISRKFLGALEQELARHLGAPGDRQDGLRWSWADRWLHVRPSGTEPHVRVFAEAAARETAEQMVATVEACAAPWLERP